jgi:hypothetical protein
MRMNQFGFSAAKPRVIGGEGLRYVCAAMKSLREPVADKIECDPSLLRIPLENIERWLANGHTAPHRLEEWRGIILRAQESPEGFHALLDLLRDTDENASRLKDFAPFAGLLTREERRAALPSCAYHF